ncbi:iron-containing alcohol dehydrogenase [Roseibium aggregatum]|uniref:Iron-containing alcohol dehydrogenase n=1 Tax=Roseibium aggregatum TaxID=187304 RepID=A0A939EIP0_9HYPH|nr:iron-containing alcohol dehydrogenase [Roseibium aggregatum]MBN9672998.1 iron-containing alcohol dehydrogenase [Roseibium aggregatum]
MFFLTDTVLGYGALAELASELKNHGSKRPLVVTDRGILQAGLIDRVVAALGVEPAATFHDTPANPTKDACVEAARLFTESGADGVVAVGGGSPIDLAKAVLVLATHEGAVETYDASLGGTARIDGTRLPPLFAIPTTAGTGSEVGQSAVISVPGARKYILRHPDMKPRVAISDPELTLTLPAAMTAGSGMDAMSHCIEGFLSPRLNPPAAAVALDGLKRIWTHLERAVEDGQDREARWHLLLGSAEGGMAMTNGLGSVHAMSHAAGGLHELKLHHGTLNAIFLPDVLRFNAEAPDVDLAPLAEATNCTSVSAFIDAIEARNERLGLPASIAAMGVSRELVPDLARTAKADFTDRTNSRPAGEDDYTRLFEHQFGAVA